MRDTLSGHLRYDSARSAASAWLSAAITLDLRSVPLRYGFIYVYFDASRCRYSFERIQRREARGLLKMYSRVDREEIIYYTVCRYSFAQLAIGAMHRHIISQTDLLELAQKRFEWFER